MCEQLFLERSVWFDSETRLGRHPNALLPAARFEINSITAQRSIDYFRDRRQALPAYKISRKGHIYSDSDFRFPIACISEAEPLAQLFSRRFITVVSTGSLAVDLEQVSRGLELLLPSTSPAAPGSKMPSSSEGRVPIPPIRWSSRSSPHRFGCAHFFNFLRGKKVSSLPWSRLHTEREFTAK